MRVIAGTARSLTLKTIEGLDTRPTTDRIKETLFNMLQTQIPACEFLDLFSGSGAIGIEALSRGARQAIFIENQKKATACIKENLNFTKLQDRAVVMECDVITGLTRLEPQGVVFDIIFMDPPYKAEVEESVLKYLSTSALINEDTLIIIEADINRDFRFVDQCGMSIEKEKRYKTNKHLFIRKK